MTKEFVIALEPRPGTLAEVLGGLAKDNVNVRGGFGTNVGDFDTWHMIVDDDARAERALKAIGTRYRTFDVVTKDVEDKPGTLLMAAERLASRGINIEAVFSLGGNAPGKTTVAFRVKDRTAAEAALKGP